MTAMQAIRSALNAGDGDVRFVQDMHDAPMARPAPGANHPMWIMGHLAVTEGRLHQILVGEPNPVEKWKPMFDWGSEPHDDAGSYPPFDEVVQAYRRLRDRTMKLVSEFGEAGLDRPPAAPPPGLEQVFPTVGQTLLTIASHQSYHCGQASVARRAAGRSPFFVPSAELRAS